jgi:hypothetical protein
MARWVQLNPEKVAAHIGVDPVKLEIVYVFANTGMEHEDTLRFLKDLDDEFELGIVWVEGVTQFGAARSTRHRVTDYARAYRSHQYTEPDHPFHSFIRKYGIPNVKSLGCTREMKLNTINSYMASLGYPRNTFYSAIGIRADERRRVSPRAGVTCVVYPLVDLEPVDKEDVLEWWSAYAWDLGIPEWQGNCLTCYKKSFKKLKAVWEDTPEVFEFTDWMERTYPRVGAEFRKYDDARDRTFFRMNHSTASLLKSFASVDGSAKRYINVLQDAGCSESCELYETEVLDDE